MAYNKEYRCAFCDRPPLLFKAKSSLKEPIIEIKCRKCGKIQKPFDPPERFSDKINNLKKK